MSTILGIESTAHTFGVGVVKNGKVLSNCKRSFSTEQGGMIPIEVAKFHCENKNEIYFEAISEAKIKETEIDAIAFSQGPGLAPCLLEGMKFAKELSKKLKKPLVPVNHCVAHLEIGRITGARDPVMLYASGANTQVIAYESGKYRVFGETLDVGVGNFIDTFGRYAGIGFPAGPAIEKLADTTRVYPDKSSAKISTKGKESRTYIELPYKVKGMDIALSGILTKLRQMLEKMNHSQAHKSNSSQQTSSSCSPKNKLRDNKFPKRKIMRNADLKQLKSEQSEVNYTLSDLAYSLQETVFAMLVETAERALAHTGKTELLLGGGVACNSRLQEMCKIMCKERGAKFFVPEKSLLVDNAGMIAYLGEIMFKKEIKIKDCDIKPRQRTDDIVVGWK